MWQRRMGTNLGGREVGAAEGDGVHPDVDGVEGAAEVGLVELVVLGPAERDVAEALLGDGVQPGEQEVEAGALHGRLVHAPRRDHAQRALQVRLDACNHQNS